MFVVVRQDRKDTYWVGELVEGSDTQSEIKLRNARLFLDKNKEVILTSLAIYGPKQGRDKGISGIIMSDTVPMVSLKNVGDWAECTLIAKKRFQDFQTDKWKQQFLIVE